MATDSRIGQEIGGYRIEALIGRGGMGTVYLAEQSFPRRKVALKLLSPELFEDQSFRDRFVRESEAAAAIDHPNIIPVYGAGEAEGCLYLAMRYVEGSDLGALLRRTGALPPEQALSIIAQAASALDAAHSRGLIHRDVKPGNILIASGVGADGTGHVYLSDFGLAKLATASIALTRPGDFVGTMHYAAPEQIEGKPLDERTDVYALGCVLYECLTGAPPFEKDSEPAIMYAHLLEQPPTATSRRPDLAPGIDAVVRKAMAKSRDERYSTAGALAEAARTGLRTAPEPPREVPAVTVPTEAGEAAGATVAAHPSAPPTTPAQPAETPSAAPTTPGEPAEAPSGAPPTTPAYAGPVSPPPSAPPTQPQYGTGPPSPPPGQPEWAGPPSPPPGGPPGAPAKSRRNLLIAIVAGVVLLAAVGGILAFTVLGGGDDEGNGGNGTAAVETGEQTTETGPAAVEVPDVVGEAEDDAVEALEDEGLEADVTTTPSEEEEGTVVSQDPEEGEEVEEGETVDLEVSGGLDPREQLLALIPSRIRATCEDPDDPNAFPEAAIAKVVCAPPNRQAHSVQYNLFETRNEMVQAYNASLDQVRDDTGEAVRGGDCETDRFAEHTWNFEGSSGRVMCYILEGNAWIEWTDNELLVYTYALRNDENDLTLYRWWDNRAFSGPRATE
jgi:serine/threonine protein kinase